MQETKNKGQPTFYYNREKRLANADANALFAVEKHSPTRKGLVKSLTSTPSLRFLFFAVILMSLAAFISAFAVGSRNSGVFGSAQLTADAMWFDGQVYITVTRGLPWYSRLNKQAASNKHLLSTLEIKTGDGHVFVGGFLQAGEKELKLRFSSASKPKMILVAITLAQVKNENDRLELFAKVK